MNAKNRARKRIKECLYDTDRCIITSLPVDRDGYVYLQHWENGGKKRFLGHRIAFELKYNIEIPKGLFICHKCDNPSCINPKHLFIGTPADNIQDMVNKGRQAKGKKNARYKNGYYSKYDPVENPKNLNLGRPHGRLLSLEQVGEIKERIKNKESLLLISKELGVKYHSVRDISCGRTYNGF